jgi:hypothetical protein
MDTFEEKLDTIFEFLDISKARGSKLPGGEREKLRIGRKGKIFTGGKKEAEGQYRRSDIEKGDWAHHTHPSDDPTPHTVLPSDTDILSAIKAYEDGIEGSKIDSGEFSFYFQPEGKAFKVKKHMLRKFKEEQAKGSTKGALDELSRLGFKWELRGNDSPINPE